MSNIKIQIEFLMNLIYKILNDLKGYFTIHMYIIIIYIDIKCVLLGMT